MPKVLWWLEHVCLQMDPLKDAVGSPFGKADNPFICSGNVLVQSTHPGPQPRPYMGLENLSTLRNTGVSAFQGF